MRIGLITDWFLPRFGGVEVQIRDLALALVARGHDVAIHTTTPGPDTIEGLDVRRLPVARAPLFGFAVSPRLPRLLHAQLAAARYDVVHVHMGIVTPAAYAAVVAARRLALPTLVTCHSVLGRTATVLRGIDRVWGLTSPLTLWSGVSGLVTAELAQALPQAETICLPNGVDLPFWTPAPAPPRDGGTVHIVSAIRLAPRKRPLALLRAFRDAKRACPGLRLKLTIAGAGPLESAVRRFIARHGLGADVTLAGLLSRPQLRSLYRDADIFVMPSLREAFGIAALEARCAGLPVVAMAQSGCTDILRGEGESQLLADDDADLARHIVRLATDTDLRRALALPSASLARFDWSEVAAAHLACYARLSELSRR